ncbi:DUF3939 domain-containing protein [Paenibacillus bovis]|uniref:DUF3939 domain-containing protein n=1 Tax=Paenibacillus bovis TaxID=1616788 RepID=A0A172ZG33_9BACL|nr:DUF3939 domain-containing protein [Paenibacillus bovis]ANF96605.1 hypothetical protein AR543_11715 [Paenibacillus bovis]
MSILERFKTKSKTSNMPSVHVTMNELRTAVLQYEREMSGINRTALMQEDRSLDLSRLTRYLGGRSDQKFYLSRETFEIFEEEERHIPYHLDQVQGAIDDYVQENGKLPVIEDSVHFEVDCRKLYQQRYLHEIPDFPMYITDQEMMVTHREPAILPESKEHMDKSYVLL